MFSKYPISKQLFFALLKNRHPLKKTIFIVFLTHTFSFFLNNGLFKKRGFGKFKKIKKINKEVTI